MYTEIPVHSFFCSSFNLNRTWGGGDCPLLRYCELVACLRGWTPGNSTHYPYQVTIYGQKLFLLTLYRSAHLFWSGGVFQLDLILPSEEGDASNFLPNGEWTLLGKWAAVWSWLPLSRGSLDQRCHCYPSVCVGQSGGARRYPTQPHSPPGGKNTTLH